MMRCGRNLRNRSASGRLRRGGLMASEPFNLKGKSRCRSAVDAADRHMADNRKMQDPQARIRRWANDLCVGLNIKTPLQAGLFPR